jgi:predicted dinucleotide-binding enzyme
MEIAVLGSGRAGSAVVRRRDAGHDVAVSSRFESP